MQGATQKVGVITRDDVLSGTYKGGRSIVVLNLGAQGYVPALVYSPEGAKKDKVQVVPLPMGEPKVLGRTDTSISNDPVGDLLRQGPKLVTKAEAMAQTGFEADGGDIPTSMRSRPNGTIVIAGFPVGPTPLDDRLTIAQDRNGNYEFCYFRANTITGKLHLQGVTTLYRGELNAIPENVTWEMLGKARFY